MPLYFAARAPGRRARRHADHGRRRAHAARARRGAGADEGALPHARLLPAHRRDRERRRRRCRRSSSEMLLAPDVRAAGARDRPRQRAARWRRRSGRATSEPSPLVRPDRRGHRRLPRGARAQEPAPLHHVRQRRRRQEHADRPPALRVAACSSRTSSRRSRPTRSEIGTQGGELDFALLLDGLAAEREQGITIDVAYRYFSTDRRKFIVADTPGHEQYTRNMVTGASTADCAVILVDARKGVLTQTRRHSYLVCAARHPPRRRRGQQDGPRRLLRGALPRDRGRLPRRSPPSSASTTSRASRVSALRGDNVVERQRQRCPGTTGPTLMRLPRDGRGRPGAHAGGAVPAARCSG